MKEDPSQTLTSYSNTTNGVVQYLKNQLASLGAWTNIPGSLSKISTSSKGYVWGYNSAGNVWTCKEPCTEGKWQKVGFGSKPLDIATDDMYVYILHTTTKEIVAPTPPPMVPIKGVPNPADIDNSIPHPPTQKPAVPTLQEWQQAGFPGSPFRRMTIGWGRFYETWKDSELARRNQAWEAGWAKYNEAYAAKKTREMAANPAKTTVTSTVITYKQVDKWDSAWQQVPIPFNATRITVTNGFLWASGNNKTAFCGKPCSTGNWNVRDDNHSLLGAGGSSVFATEPGKLGVFKSNETAQTGWTPVGGLQGVNASTIAAEADNSVLYTSDMSKVYRCTDTCKDKKDLEVVNSMGFVPIQDKGSMTINPNTRNVWMTSQVGSTGGNIFARLDAPDMAPVLNYVDDTEKSRDRMFNSLGDSLTVQTAQISSGMSKKEASDAVKRAIDLTGDRRKVDSEIQLLERKIEDANNQVASFTDKKKPLVTLLVSLALVAIMYLTVGWFMPYGLSMGFAVLVLGTGLGLSIYFSTNK